MFVRGTLWSLIQHASREALASGELQSIPTEYELVEDAGVQFIVRVVRALARKSNLLRPNRDRADTANPFLPYHPQMFVADISRTHVCLLNKYNVVEHHVLIVTRQFQHQETRLRLADFHALAACMKEVDGLGFYNSGSAAGASQPHKHLQLAPLPLAPEGLALPIEPLLRMARYRQGLGYCPVFPFVHALARITPEAWHSLRGAARHLSETYRRLLSALGVDPEGKAGNPNAYNLLVTRQWMLVVPRSQEFCGTVSLNALAFAGTLLVRDRKQLQELLRRGPLRALEDVAVARKR